MAKAHFSDFVSRNPFPHPLTTGFYFREKMRAIHSIAPDCGFQGMLEIGGGRSGLTGLLYPHAHVFNIDVNPKYGRDSCNRQGLYRFVCGDAAELPFDDESFDAITMFDVLEHISEDDRAVSEVHRVLRPSGFCLVSTPNEAWRFPYYDFMRPICPSETEIMAHWGHVRRGYSLAELSRLLKLHLCGYATFIAPLTVFCHDISFSRVSSMIRRGLCLALSPLTWLGYALHRPHDAGTQTASLWQKP
jgi:ubiquinone/menaquinone biosynthesis C-methylase UbiE